MTRYVIPDEACEFRFVHASGPGGQHVNKSSTAVELRVAVARLRLPPAAEARLRTQQKNRLNKDGELVIQAEQFRSQLKNRRDALERLTQMIEAARERPKRRVPTRPTAASKRRRIDTKKQRGQLKSQRQKPAPD